MIKPRPPETLEGGGPPWCPRQASPAAPGRTAGPQSRGANRSRWCRTPRPRPAPAAAAVAAAPAVAGGDWAVEVAARDHAPRAVAGAARGPQDAWQLCPEAGPRPRSEFRPSPTPWNYRTNEQQERLQRPTLPRAVKPIETLVLRHAPPPTPQPPSGLGDDSPESYTTLKGARKGEAPPQHERGSQ